ncbi:MAG: Brp/Blh family beta-carotene 15,15'-dioxygenase [Flavobacteriales bacterium]
MNFYLFIYIVCSYAITIIFQAYSNIPIDYQIIGSAILLLCIGIPHGTLDHLITYKVQKTNKLKFYTYYLGTIVLFFLIWMIAPSLGFVLFLLISAFHFGETQLHFFFTKNTYISLFIYLNWGVTILFTLLYYNNSELNQMTQLFEDTQVFLSVYDYDTLKPIFIASNLGSILSFVYLFYKNKMSSQSLLAELFFLAVIHLTSFLFPFIICFTLFFIVLHSLPSIVHQFTFFKKFKKDFTKKELIQLMAPYSILSISMSAILIALSHLNYIPFSIPLISLIVISAITLPHTFVMLNFNNKSKLTSSK